MPSPPPSSQPQRSPRSATRARHPIPRWIRSECCAFLCRASPRGSLRGRPSAGSRSSSSSSSQACSPYCWIEDPTAPLERRIAAATPLAAVDREGVRCHARRAANACADGAWPAALQCAAEGNLTLAILQLDSRLALRESRRVQCQAFTPSWAPPRSSRDRLVIPDHARLVRNERSMRSARRRREERGVTAWGATRAGQRRPRRALRRGVNVRSCARARRLTPR